MKIQKFNWQIWAGFFLSLIGLFSYAFVLVTFPVTRDFPWANLLLFGISAVLLLVGVRHAFAPDRRKMSKIGALVVASLSVAIIGLFLFSFFVTSRWLPASRGAPKIGQKAPAFSLADTNG